jgi:putative transposase
VKIVVFCSVAVATPVSTSLRPRGAVHGALVRQAPRRGGHRPLDGKGGLGTVQNALAESFLATLKTELVHRHRFPSREAARIAVFEYLEAFYNRRRLHSALGYRSPADFEGVTMEGVAVA